jgi:hypothetical protein
MATAQHIIERAFTKIGIRAAETPLTASEIADGLDNLNNLLSTWDASGVLKGVPPIADVGMEVEAPRYAIGALQAQVAIMLAGEYGVSVSSSLAAEVTLFVDQLIAASINLQDIKYPSTLPVGSGNQDGYGADYYRDYFPGTGRRNF